MGDDHTLIVMRHAKAAELPGKPDFDRPLRPRGRRDSAAAGQWLASHGFRPDLVLCSAAERTRQTWEHLSPELGGSAQFSAERRLYQADADDVSEVIQETDETAATVLYIGHNPAAAELAALLTGTEPDFPTAAIAVVRLAEGWASLAPGAGELVASWVPRPRG
ncbi:MAG TPA: histidine phosphatase family protein [Streptosporangiaceae bacterium]|nr:histidine phosphatase family protein [Streptosporangiaceae bacterium]